VLFAPVVVEIYRYARAGEHQHSSYGTDECDLLFLSPHSRPHLALGVSRNASHASTADVSSRRLGSLQRAHARNWRRLISIPLRTMVVPRQVNAGAHDSRAHESRSQSGDNGPRPAAPGQWTPAAQNQDAFFEGMGPRIHGGSVTGRGLLGRSL
jgi:hypothetical protein